MYGIQLDQSNKEYPIIPAQNKRMSLDITIS